MTGRQQSATAVLAEAARLIEHGGLCKGSMTNGRGYCALGAIFTAGGTHFRALDGPELWASAPDRVHTAVELLETHLETLGHPRALGVDRWNDATERTPRDVTKALRAAATTGRKHGYGTR